MTGTKVAVCVATFQRPKMLGALLHSLGELVIPEGAPEVVVVVVDNDAAGSARRVLDAARATLPWRLVAGHEPVRNIALARNLAVTLALADGADWIAFVDDDERVSPRWLAELLRVQRETGADVVSGTVVNEYVDAAPRWIVDGGLPLRSHYPTGTESDGADTSNVLIARRVFGLVPGHFDPRFGRSGGSDSLFFLRARRAGARIVWADEALVHETFVATRTTARWLLRRAFRTGNSTVLVARAGLPAWQWLPRRVAGACYRLGRGLALLVAAPVRGRGAAVRALQDVCLGLGALTALAGYRFVEYTQSHGS